MVLIEVAKQNYFDTEPCPTTNVTLGNQRTLTSLLGDMFHEAEKLYGPRLINHTILGVSYHKDGPRTIPMQDDASMLVVQLGLGIGKNPQEATYQLAHESIHCFAKNPAGHLNTNLEEGLAVWFSINYMKKFYVTEAPPKQKNI